MAVPNPRRLTAVGPVDPASGYPLWFADAAGTVLGLGLDATDPFLPARGGLPPTRPPGFDVDVPDESFYFLAEAEMEIGGGPDASRPGRARLTLALEAAFAADEVVDGDQVVFARIRIRLRNVMPNAAFVVTHPYGVADVTADGDGEVFVTEDLGLVEGDVTAVVAAGQVAPFLTSATAPAGYLGDGATPGPVSGSPFGTNEFRVAGPDVRVGVDHADPADPTNTDLIVTDAFTVQGRLATVLGVGVDRAVHGRDATGAVVLDVFASTRPGQAVTAGGGGGIVPETALLGAGPRYVARIATGTTLPVTVDVTNTGDTPPWTVTVPVTDAVTVTAADHDPAAGTLTVAASSSDALGAPVLTVTGFGAMTGPTTVFAVDAPPTAIEVVSAAGGRARSDVRLVGPVQTPVPVVAAAGPDLVGVQGGTAVLDGSASTGATTFAWSQTGGTPVALSGAGTAVASFTVPPVVGVLSFTLTATGPGGTATDTVEVTVPAPAAAVAVAGPDLSAAVGDTAVLDGTGSLNMVSALWVQTAGPPVVLTEPTALRTGFAMPAGAVQLTLTVTGPTGPSSADGVLVSPVPDVITVQRARFRRDRDQWRVDGGATAPLPDEVTVRLDGVEIGVSPVAGDGTWSVRRDLDPAESALRPGAGDVVQVASTRGGTTGAPVTITN